MAKDIKVTLSIKKFIGSLGFGYPLIFAGKQEAAVDYTECSTLEDVVTAGFAATTAVYKAAQLMLSQEDRPQKFAVCASTDTTVTALPAIKNKGWRQLVVVSSGESGESTTAEVAAWIETTSDKMYFAKTATYADLSAFDYDRTVLFYYTGETPACPEAAIVGATAGKTVGSFTYKNIVIKGVEPLELTDTVITAVHTAGCITLVEKAGDRVLSEGITTGGEYIDIVDSKDFIISEMEYRMQKLLNNTNKVTFDNNGISMLESVCVTVLHEAFTNGIIAVNDDGTPNYSVNFASRADTSATDRAKRTYNGGKFSFGLAGAIHYANITGEIEI